VLLVVFYHLNLLGLGGCCCLQAWRR